MPPPPAAAAPPLEAPALEALTGRSLGDFVLRDKLGQGAFGAVYRAEQPSLSREAVVKVLLSKEGNGDEAVMRFLREAKLAAQLDHPYAAHVYAFGAEPDGLLWIALEHVRGTTLHQLLKTQGPLPLSRFVPLLEGICEVVQTAHEQGIIHRDLKPANVMVMTRAGRLLPKLLDFGIARIRADLSGPNPGPTDLASLPEQPLLDSVRTELTQGGKLIGSPHYMAPEQWLNAHTVDARADVYALGVLSYQCLTAKLPFPGATVKDVAREHATRPVPALPQGLPPALSEVLQRAMAKKVEERIGSASELASQIREAAGLAEAPGHLPQLPESLKETLIAEAPQPLAEAVAALEASRSTAAAVEATTIVVKVVARLLAALALSARARVGEKTPLSETDSATLARGLVEPFAGRPNAHPVPELITFLTDARRSAELFVDPLAPRSLAERLRGLTQLLSATSFLSSYLWAVARPEGLERWMGVRRPTRAWAGAVPPEVIHGQVALLTREGKLVLVLHPLVQVLAPAPGVAEELFVFEGRGRYGAKLVAYPAGFERHDEAAWDWLALEEERSEGKQTEAPYRGLAAFTANDRDNFFGREREVQDFLNRLRLQPLVAVVGPSGAGKSSFVQAGVLPALPTSWKPVTVRPGPRPLLALEEKLRSEGLPVDGLRESPATLGARLRSAAREEGVTFLLIVDQFEELITLCLSVEERRQYAEALVSAAASLEAPVRLVLTLRDDFLIRLQQLPPLRDRLGHGMQLLATPADEDLLRILIEPARRGGYAFDDPELPRQMVDAVALHPGALALLSFTASQLWAMRDRSLKMLVRKAYEAMGGVGGALAHHAEATLALFSEAEQEMVREAFRNLVTAEGTRAVLSRKEMEQILGGSGATGSVIERLILARLLVSSEGTPGEDRIEVIHEALLSSWPRLVRWQREDADNARMRDLLRSAARQWNERGRPVGLLWRDDALTEYRLWRARTQGAVTEVEEAFASASIKEHTKGRRLRLGIVAGAFAALIAGLIVVSISQRQARLSERAAAESLLNLYEEQGRQLILGSDYLRGLVYLSRAYNGGHQSAGLRYLAGKAAQGLGAQRSTLAAHQHPIISAAFSPDGRRVVTVADEENTGRLWDGVSGGPIAELLGHEGGLIAGWFSFDGGHVYTVARDGTVRFWDPKQGALTQTVHAHDGTAVWAELSRDNSVLITAGTDKTAKIWRMPSGELLHTLEGHQDFVIAARFRPGEKELVTCSGDGTARVWDVASGRQRWVLKHDGPIYFVAYSPDGTRIVTTGEDSKARLWDADNGEWIADLSHGAPVMSAAFSPDSRHVVTGALEREPRVWDARTGAFRRRLVGHGSMARFVTYSPDGTRIFSAGADGAALVWNAKSFERICSLVGHLEGVFRVVPSPDGKRLLTASLDGSAKLWDADRCRPPLLFGTPGAVSDARISADGTRLLVASAGALGLHDTGTRQLLQKLDTEGKPRFGALSSDGRWVAGDEGKNVRLWDLLHPGTTRLLEGHSAHVEDVAFSPDGALLASAGSDGTVRLWNVAEAKLLSTLPHPAAVRSVAFGANSARLVTGSEDGTARLWDVRTSGLVRQFLGTREQRVVSVQLSTDGNRLVTSGWPAFSNVWDVESGKTLARLEHPAEVSSARFLAGGDLVLTGCLDGASRVFEVKSGRLLDTFPQSSPIHTLDLDGRNRFVTTGPKDAAQVWSLPRMARSAEDVERLVRCFIPLRLEGERLVKAQPFSCTREPVQTPAQVAQGEDHVDNP